MKKIIMRFVGLIWCCDVMAGSVTQCTRVEALLSENWSGTATAGVAHQILEVDNVFSNIRVVSTCSADVFTSLATIADYIGAPTSDPSAMYCWCKIIRPVATPWFPSGQFAGNNSQITSLDNCLYVCPQFCAERLLTGSGIVSDVMVRMHENNLSDIIGAEISGSCSTSEGLNLTPVERYGVAFSDNCSDVGGTNISGTVLPCGAANLEYIQNTGGTCFDYFPKEYGTTNETGTYSYTSPCNEL